MSSDRFARHLVSGSAPLMVWALHFFAAYVLVAAGCCTSWAETPWFGISALRVSLLLLSALAMLAIAALLARSVRQRASLLRSAGAGGGLLSLVGVVWTTLPMASPLPLCVCA